MAAGFSEHAQQDQSISKTACQEQRNPNSVILVLGAADVLAKRAPSDSDNRVSVVKPGAEPIGSDRLDYLCRFDLLALDPAESGLIGTDLSQKGAKR